MREPRPAEEWHDVDADLFEKTIRTRGRPAVLRGLVRSWPATQAGSESPLSLSAYLKSFYTGHPAPLFEGPASIGGRFFYNDTLDGFNFESKRASLGEVLDRLCHDVGIESSPARYAGSVSLPIYFPGFSKTNNAARLITDPGATTLFTAHFRPEVDILNQATISGQLGTDASISGTWKLVITDFKNDGGASARQSFGHAR